MAERKVINKYIPPTFNAEKIEFFKSKNQAKIKARVMAPFSMRCENCGEYIYKGTKFNAVKDKPHGEKYLGIQIHRLTIKCPGCHGDISYKTDPKNTDYVIESGATRNVEQWRRNAQEENQILEKRQREEELDPLKKLENKTVDARREIEILEGLDALKSRQDALEAVDVDQAAKRVRFDIADNDDARRDNDATTQQLLDEQREDEERARLAFKGKQKMKVHEDSLYGYSRQSQFDTVSLLSTRTNKTSQTAKSSASIATLLNNNSNRDKTKMRQALGIVKKKPQ
ncbi:hypothetical protein MIR68_008303 [Amoeboaphelidium protococcarum]|nr:hypothetical protein MIR68_008303 [Amoeboaphelidium protococcarum]